ncbi:hypothetical protein Syun_000742 [Stephania yunnanensis]|uniref:Uncharacterized protein n=1 Tax=Stephania yunnanensis TaxID=152371 RepID=A0AAP0LE85_9MAGN
MLEAIRCCLPLVVVDCRFPPVAVAATYQPSSRPPLTSCLLPSRHSTLPPPPPLTTASHRREGSQGPARDQRAEKRQSRTGEGPPRDERAERRGLGEGTARALRGTVEAATVEAGTTAGRGKRRRWSEDGRGTVEAATVEAGTAAGTVEGRWRQRRWRQGRGQGRWRPEKATTRPTRALRGTVEAGMVEVGMVEVGMVETGEGSQRPYRNDLGEASKQEEISVRQMRASMEENRETKTRVFLNQVMSLSGSRDRKS